MLVNSRQRLRIVLCGPPYLQMPNSAYSCFPPVYRNCMVWSDLYLSRLTLLRSGGPYLLTLSKLGLLIMVVHLSLRNRASGAPNSVARKNNTVLPKLASSSTRPRSSTTSNTPLALPGSRLSPGSRVGPSAAVAGSLALKRQRRTSTGGPGSVIRKFMEGDGT